MPLPHLTLRASFAHVLFALAQAKHLSTEQIHQGLIAAGLGSYKVSQPLKTAADYCDLISRKAKPAAAKLAVGSHYKVDKTMRPFQLCQVLIPLCAGHPRSLQYLEISLRSDDVNFKGDDRGRIMHIMKVVVKELSDRYQANEPIPFSLAFRGKVLGVEHEQARNFMLATRVGNTWRFDNSEPGILSFNPLGLFSWAQNPTNDHALCDPICGALLPKLTGELNFKQRWMALTAILRYAHAADSFWLLMPNQ